MKLHSWFFKGQTCHKAKTKEAQKSHFYFLPMSLLYCIMHNVDMHYINAYPLFQKYAKLDLLKTHLYFDVNYELLIQNVVFRLFWTHLNTPCLTKFVYLTSTKWMNVWYLLFVYAIKIFKQFSSIYVILKLPIWCGLPEMDLLCNRCSVMFKKCIS